MSTLTPETFAVVSMLTPETVSMLTPETVSTLTPETLHGRHSAALSVPSSSGSTKRGHAPPLLALLSSFLRSPALLHTDKEN